MSAAVERELRSIRRLPYGAARTAAAEAVARRIDAEGPRNLLPEALLDLVEAYTFNSEGAKSFVVFARLLRLWDESPELFDADDTRTLFWEYKWVASDVAEYPQITTEQAAAFLDDMQRRFELAGCGLSAVRKLRFRDARNVGSPTAEAARLAWVTAERDSLEDCDACRIGQQVQYFTETGRHGEAVKLGLTQRDSCNLEPTVTHHGVALSALLIGDPELAVDQYHRAMATAVSDRRSIGSARGEAFELLARGGHLGGALRALRTDDVVLLHDAESPLSHLRFLLGLLAGLSANLDHGTTATGLRDAAHSTVADLHAWTLERVTELAARFDARNGNAYYAGRTNLALAATRTERPLDLTPAGRGWDARSDHDGTAPDPGGSRTEAPGPGRPGVGDGDGHGGETPPGNDARADALYARAEAAASRGDFVDASAEYLAAAAAFETDGLLARAGAARAEAAQCAVLAGDDRAAHEGFASAVPLLVAGGAAEETTSAVLAAWAPHAVRMDDVAGALRALAEARDRLEAPADSGPATARAVPDEVAENHRVTRGVARATVRDALARTLASVSREQVPATLRDVDPADEALAAGEDFARLGHAADAAHAFWLVGVLRRDAGDGEAALWALESAFEGFTVAGERVQRARVAGDLIELLRATGQAERADHVTAELTR